MNYKEVYTVPYSVHDEHEKQNWLLKYDIFEYVKLENAINFNVN